MQAEDRGFADVLTMTSRPRRPRGPAQPFRRSPRRAARPGKGHRASSPDFAHQDVPLILMANAGVVPGTRDAAPDAWRRLLAYLLQAFAAETAHPLPEPPTPAQMYRALMRLPQERLALNGGRAESWPAPRATAVRPCHLPSAVRPRRRGIRGNDLRAPVDDEAALRRDRKLGNEAASYCARRVRIHGHPVREPVAESWA